MTYTVPAGRYGDYSTAFIQAYIDAKIAGVLDTAPETLDTLNELAAAINDDPTYFSTVAAQVAELNTDVADAVAALGVAENDTTFGTFTAGTLPDGVTLKAVLEAFASAYETTKSNLEGADSTLSGRIDVLEADPTTATSLAAVQADVDQNELDGDAADSALSGRLDTLEVDPTTATAVAAVQSDVDQNETDSDAADAALSARLDVLEADPTTATAVAAVQADVNQNEADADAAIATERGRIDAILLAADADKDSFAEIVSLINSVDTTNDNAFAAYVLSNDAAVAAVQADVDQNEFDADAAIAALQADVDQNEADADAAIAGILDGATFTGDIVVNEGTGSTIKLETSDATSAGIHIEGPTGSMGYIDTTNGFGNDSLQIYSANTWCRAINGGTGNLIVDGRLTLAIAQVPEYSNDTQAAAGGVAIGCLYRSGSVLHIRSV